MTETNRTLSGNYDNYNGNINISSQVTCYLALYV